METSQQQSFWCNAVVLGLTGLGMFQLVKFVNSRWLTESLLKQLQEAQASAERERTMRLAERKGRVNAQQQLRELQLRLAAAGAPEAEAEAELAAAPEQGEQDEQKQQQQQQQRPYQEMPILPFQPIGRVHSCFTTRNGTPRQPLLVPGARCRLTLAQDFPADCLEGLELYSHVWVLYVFHANTDLSKLLSAGGRSGVKGKIRVPRLDGGKMGVLATRSPHRPVPIGLSVAQVLGVSGNTLLLGGADIVDGSPVLDIKPYLPFCDAVATATAPAWVAREAEQEPLHVAAVTLSEEARLQLQRCWAARRGQSLYASAEEFESLVTQVLSRDIRSLHKRRDGQCSGQESSDTVFHVILEATDVSYTISSDGLVVVHAVSRAT